MIFHIKKGHHYSDSFIYKFFHLFNDRSRMSRRIIFNDTDIYVDTTPDKFDINKLFGFSVGWHHTNSYRFGWNCFDGKIHIYAYGYVNKQRVIEEICTIETNLLYRFTINLKTDTCIFSVIDQNDKISQKIIKAPHKNSLGYKLWPYFGGNKTAPKDISLEFYED